MITPIDLLIAGNYYIEYNFDDATHVSTISFSKDPNFSVRFKYDNDQQTLNFVDDKMSAPYATCSPEAVRTMLTRILYTYCEDLNKYPLEYVVYKLNGNRTSRMYYYVGSTVNEAKRDLFYDMYMEIQHDGLQAAHLDLAEEHGLWADLRQLLQDILGIDIGAERL